MMMDTSDAPVTSAMPCLPPGGLFEIVFSFDTTGSMSSVADEVKGRLQDMIQRLQADIPGIRIGVIAHGDYCDKDIFYLEKHIDFSNNIVDLCNFLNSVEGTGGGDPEECYEYILHMATEFSWTAGSQRALVVIGDATPHDVDYDLNVDNLDWKFEAEKLAEMGIKIYGVQAFENADSTAFFQELAEITSGHHVKLGEFSHICDFIMAICYREKGEDFLVDYEAEVRAREGRKKLANDLEGLFGVLRRGDSSVSNKSGPSELRKSSSSASSKSGPSMLRKSSSSASNKSGPSLLRKSSSSVSNKSGSSMMRKTGSFVSVMSDGRPCCLPREDTPVPSSLSRSSSGSSWTSLSSWCKSGFKSSTSVVRKKRPRPVSLIQSPKPGSKKPLGKQVKHTQNKNKQKAKILVPSKKTDGSISIKQPETKLRHKVPDTKFVLKQNGLETRWSPWKLAITCEAPKSTKVWVKRDKGQRKNGLKPYIGWRKRALFPKGTGKTRVLYEIATQQKSGEKMHIMYNKWSVVGANPENWERRLFGKESLRNVLEGVLMNNCKVFVRRFVARGLGKNQRHIVRLYRKQYKYAWSV